MKTKLFTLFLALVSSVGSIFAVSGTCGDNLTWNLTDGVLTISGTGNMDDWDYYSSSPWHSECITSVTIGNSVTSIGNWAFASCEGLTNVNIPNSVTSIGNGAFYGCSGLTSVTIGNSVTSIGDWAFGYCSGLTNVTIPNSVTSIGVYAFGYCSGLTSVTIPNSVTSIGDFAFYGCSGLTSVTIGNSVTSIGENPFALCYALTSVTINSNSIVSKTYTSDQNIESLFGSQVTNYIIGSDVVNIGDCAFYDCYFLTSIEIPNSITNIGDYAFRYCSNLTNITIPNSVTSIGSYAFESSGLTNVTIGNSVTSIGDYAFKKDIGGDEYPSLTVTFLGEHPASLGAGALYSVDLIYLGVCGTLNSYQSAWPDYASRIAYTPLIYEITTIATNGYCEIKGATVCDNNAQITAHPNRGYRFVKWADGVTENPRIIPMTHDITIEAIFDYALTGKCGKDSALVWTFDPSTMALNITGKGDLSNNYTYGSFIESLTIGNEVTSIGWFAFEYCRNLKNVIIGSSVKVLEEYAFYNCYAIETITCYSQRPPTVKQNALAGVGYSTIVYVPAEYLNTYKMHDAWGLYDVRPLGATSTETNGVTVTPTETTVQVVWPSISGAATYELVIKDKNGSVICTLVFNAQGQLLSMAFNAPKRNNAPQQTQTAGFAFTVTGLDSGTGYDLTLTSKDNSGNTLDSKTVSFSTTGESTAINQIVNGQTPTKVMRNGQLFIRRGNELFNTTGARVR